jgi:hypothetical protein
MATLLVSSRFPVEPGLPPAYDLREPAAGQPGAIAYYVPVGN